MKHTGNCFIYGAQRDRELYAAYLNVLNTMPVVNRNRAYQLAANSPCSRYWISEERAREIIKRLMDGEQVTDVVKGHSGRWGKSSSLQVEQITSLFNRFKEVVAEHPKARLTEQIYLAVSSPAPKFFITQKSAKAFCCRYRKSMSIMDRLRMHAHVRISE